MTWRTVRAAVCVVVGLAACGLGPVGPAHAQTERERQTQACRGDAVRLCTLAIPNEEKITRCMERKRDQLSPACKVYFTQGGQKSGPNKGGAGKAGAGRNSSRAGSRK
ncbi:hypothetical protein [Acetobacter garciniae]|uniref:hypothetical protein n=1 Tax=Acetobacter garciniae TaxID=2817435 RepID=UPI001E40E741|nr:hypothetical protein [Acetobacter garciniae]